MKAKTINNSPFGWNTTVYDNDDYPMEYTLNGLVNKHDAVGVTESFNLELSAHVAKETERLQAEIDTVKREKLVLNLLIDEITDGNCLKQSKAKLSVENSELKSEIDRLKKEVEMQNQDINNHQQTSATLNKMYKQAIDDLTISQAEVERLNGDKWISVDEKPKEGKPVLICVENEYKNRFVLRATWIPRYSMTTDDADYEGDADYNEENDHYYWPEGWYEWNLYEEIHFCVDGTVIAWQPLPQPK